MEWLAVILLNLSLSKVVIHCVARMTTFDSDRCNKTFYHVKIDEFI